jgi:hypothetical protein
MAGTIATVSHRQLARRPVITASSEPCYFTAPAGTRSLLRMSGVSNVENASQGATKNDFEGLPWAERA